MKNNKNLLKLVLGSLTKSVSHPALMTGSIMSSYSEMKDSITLMKYPPNVVPEHLSQLGCYSLDQSKITYKTTPPPKSMISLL